MIVEAGKFMICKASRQARETQWKNQCYSSSLKVDCWQNTLLSWRVQYFPIKTSNGLDETTPHYKESSVLVKVYRFKYQPYVKTPFTETSRIMID